MFLKTKKALALVFTTGILYYALTSPKLLPDVTIPVKDALVISLFVILSSLCMRYICLIQTRRLEKKILLQHSQMQTIINNTPLIMYLKNIDGTVLLSNQAHSKLLNISEDKLIGKNAYDLYKNSELYKQEDAQIINSRESILIERIIETNNRHQGWYRIVKAPVFNEQGDVTGIVVISKNIDCEKEIENRKNTFIATLTHDLKTPTIAQIKALDLILNNTLGELDDAQRELISQIKNSCKYMNDLIFTILDTYLYENGQTRITPEEFNITELLKETINEIANLSDEKEQKIIINNKLGTKNIVGDRFQLKRVIINLVSNAIKYGFNQSEIEIIVEEKNSDITLNVKNKAKYIPEAKILDLYEKFKTTENTRLEKRGMGLGLYLSKQIIDAHNGRVHAKSSKDNTCVFGFSIPKPKQNATNVFTNPYVESRKA